MNQPMQPKPTRASPPTPRPPRHTLIQWAVLAIIIPLLPAIFQYGAEAFGVSNNPSFWWNDEVVLTTIFLHVQTLMHLLKLPELSGYGRRLLLQTSKYCITVGIGVGVVMLLGVYMHKAKTFGFSFDKYDGVTERFEQALKVGLYVAVGASLLVELADLARYERERFIVKKGLSAKLFHMIKRWRKKSRGRRKNKSAS